MAEGMTVDSAYTREECGAFWQVAAWPGTLGAVAAHLGKVVGSEAPGPGRIITTDAGQIARIGPLVWWIIGATPQAIEALADISVEDGTVLDMTDNRTRFVVSGPYARDIMMRLAPLDFRDRAFPIGQIVATAAHHMSVQVVRREEAWDVYVTSTFADALEELLAETAAQWA